MKLTQLKIDPDFRDCLPKLSSEEYKQLEKNILEYGVQTPLIVWNGFVVDGHNRYNICLDNGIEEAPVHEEHFETKEGALQWILENQLGRRNLTDFARCEIALKYKEVISKAAKKRMGGDRKSPNRKISLAPRSQADPKKIHTADELAKIAGTSAASIKRTSYILKHGTEEDVERARTGGNGNGIRTIVNDIKRRGLKPGEKMCNACGKIKPLSEFSKNRSKSDGYSGACKECDNKRRTKSFKQNNVSDEQDAVIKAMVEAALSPETKPYTVEMIVSELKAEGMMFIDNLASHVKDTKNKLPDDEPVDAIKEAIEEIIREIKKLEETL